MDGNSKEKQYRLAVYLRVSTEEQAEKYGIDAQREAVVGLLKTRGKLADGRDAFVLAGKQYEYLDDGISGTTEIDQRPEFARLKEDILNAPEGEKPFDMVAVYKIDRFARKLRILLDVLKLFEENNIEFISTTESIDTSTPFGRAMLGIMGVIAELELETIKERMGIGREQAILTGVVMGSYAKYGYNKDEFKRLIINEKEAEIVRMIFNLFVFENQTPQQIADQLDKRGVVSPEISAIEHKKFKGESKKKNPVTFWRGERIRKILSDDVYLGIQYYNKKKGKKDNPKSEWKVSPYHHEPIIFKDIFQLAQDRLAKLSSRLELTARKEFDHIYLLSGKLKCDQCKSLSSSEKRTLMSWTGTKRKLDQKGRYSFYYACNRKNRKKFNPICSVVPLPAQQLEDYVVEFVKDLLRDPTAAFEYQKSLDSTKLGEKHLKDKRKQFANLLEGIPGRKKRLSEQQELGVIDTTTLVSKLNDLKGNEQEYLNNIDEIDSKLSRYAIPEGYLNSFQKYASKYGKSLEKVVNDRKELFNLINGLISQIVIYSRDSNELDSVSGRKKEKQFIPERMDIYLNLPQVLLKQLHSQKFGVKDSPW